MTTPGASCKAVAIQDSSEWPCSMCPFPQLRLVGVRTSFINISLVFPGHLEFWTPLQIPIWAPPLGCTLLQNQSHNFKQQQTCSTYKKTRKMKLGDVRKLHNQMVQKPNTGNKTVTESKIQPYNQF